MRPTVQDEVISTGIAGLDDIMSGGFTRRRLFLVEGVPGSGKTTLAMQFLLAGVSQGEPVLYVTLSETAEELKASAASHGWSLDGIEIRELAPTEAALDPDEQPTMFHPSEGGQADRPGQPQRVPERDARGTLPGPAVA